MAAHTWFSMLPAIMLVVGLLAVTGQPPPSQPMWPAGGIAFAVPPLGPPPATPAPNPAQANAPPAVPMPNVWQLPPAACPPPSSYNAPVPQSGFQSLPGTAGGGNSANLGGGLAGITPGPGGIPCSPVHVASTPGVSDTLLLNNV